MNFFENILGAPAARRYRAFFFFFPLAEAQSRRGGKELSIQCSVFSVQKKMPSRGSAFPGCLPRSPQDFAVNDSSERKEQASCLRSQVGEVFSTQFSVYSVQCVMPHRRAALPGLLHSQVLRKIKNYPLCASAPLREIISKDFSTQISVFSGKSRKVLRGALDLGRIKKSLLCASASLREIISNVFSAQFSVFKELTRIGMRGALDLERIKNSLLCVSAPLREVFKKSQIKICDNLRNLRINLFSLVPNPQNLVPNEQTEFAS